MKQIQPFQKHWLQITSIVVCRLKYTAAMSYRWDIKSYVWDTYAVAKSVIIIKITSKERLAADGLS